MLTFKEGLDFCKIQPQLVLGLVAAYTIWERYTYGIPFVVTSLCDGVHSPNSLHYRGLAADIRIRNLGADLASSITRLLKHHLGENFDVVLESNHIHIEYDPKTTKH